tara:strand:- start:3727 stop:4782 length:1056 start_codon:yes stop_codon:yes gene_type:complete
MKKYYTRVCNFYYGSHAWNLIKKKKALPLNGDLRISFDHVEILSRKSNKVIHINQINKLPTELKKKINKDILNISKRKKNFANLNFKKLPNIMGVLNLTPDSFSDGGKYNKKNLGYNHAIKLYKSGSDIIDVGGESTRPMSNIVDLKEEWKRIKLTLTKLKRKKIPISLDTRKSLIMKKGIKLGIKLINDISGLKFDQQSVNVIKKSNIPFVIQHIQGNPSTMQKKPKYKDVLLDIYDYFENRIKFVRSNGIKHNNIILDPGIGFGKNLKHNIILISKISLFHSLGFPVLLGTSRKKFIKDISRKNDSKERIGGTIGSSLFAIMQGIQILRVHDVNEVIQSIKIFKELLKQ